MAKPIIAKEVLQLTKSGVYAANVKFKNVTLQSSKYITIREEVGKPNDTNWKAGVSIIEIANKNSMFLPVTVDSAIMNPATKVVALRAKQNLQIYNLDMKTKMKSTSIQSQVMFWKWLNPKTIAIITDTEVLHWSMDDERPVKMFDRAKYDGQVQILNYRVSKDEKWLILGGITKSNQGVAGVLQVYSVDIKASQPTLNSSAACFAEVKIDGRDKTCTLFCFTQY